MCHQRAVRGKTLVRHDLAWYFEKAILTAPSDRSDIRVVVRSGRATFFID
jgi:hypothetical protein